MNSPLVTPPILDAARADQAVAYLKTYYGVEPGSTAYTGASFELVGAEGNDPMAITAADLVSLATLSVPVSGRAAIRLLSDVFQAKSRELLADVPVDATIADNDAMVHLAEQGASPAAQLWKLIDDVPDMGLVSTSKLLARKRPALIPVYDTVIDAQLDLNGTAAMWSRYHEWVNRPTDDGGTLIAHAEHLHAEAKLPEYVTPLRVIDVVLWMDGKQAGAKTEENDERDA